MIRKFQVLEGSELEGTELEGSYLEGSDLEGSDIQDSESKVWKGNIPRQRNAPAKISRQTVTPARISRQIREAPPHQGATPLADRPLLLTPT